MLRLAKRVYICWLCPPWPTGRRWEKATHHVFPCTVKTSCYTERAKQIDRAHAWTHLLFGKNKQFVLSSRRTLERHFFSTIWGCAWRGALNRLMFAVALCWIIFFSCGGPKARMGRGEMSSCSTGVGQAIWAGGLKSGGSEPICKNWWGRLNCHQFPVDSPFDDVTANITCY